MKKYIIIGIVSFFMILGISLPFLFEKIEYQKTENKVKVINQLFQKREDYQKAKKTIQKKSRISYDSKVTKELLKYVELYQVRYDRIQEKEYQSIFHFEKKEEMNEEIPKRVEYLKEMIVSLEKNQKDILKLSSKKYPSKTKYGTLMRKIQQKEIKKYGESLKEDIDVFHQDIESLEYLKNHIEDVVLLDKTIEFQKRKPYQEFESLEKKRITKRVTFSLVKDEKPPVIQGENFSIYLNNSVDLSSKTHCVDEVDGEVECQFHGEYDKNKIGTYPIEVKAKDESGNESSKTIQVKVISKPQKPYKIDVIRNQNVVIVYGVDGNGEYTNVVKVFVSSTGKNNATPVGSYSTSKERTGTWGSLYGGVWGQYTTRIVGSILFHSVPYYTKNKGDLEWEEYNKLGTQASAGCVRMAVRDVKWIYYNIPVGTPVHIYDGEIPSGISKPSAIKIDGSSPNRGWDPTDDDPANPWNS